MPILVVGAVGALVEIGGTWATIQKLELLRDRALATGNTKVPSPWDTYKFPLLVYARFGDWCRLLAVPAS